MTTRNYRIIAVAVLGISPGLLIAPPQPTAAGEADKTVTAERSYQRWSRAYQLRPRRPTDPLRETNISDNEVRQIEQATRAVFPTALVNISGVTSGCPCEDGPDCTDQVWVVAWHSEESHGLKLSLIGGEWVIGPVQRWWLQYESLGDRYDALGALDTEEKWAAARGLMRERMSLIESFPECEPGPARAGEQDDRG
ncbi:hypothetical protein [Lentisalinibacter sediminis]|uniref:hypothetical protein n=1 Tax=Lentisalinibacter sediminis TaxID=2992237 RepID=UPI00386B963F